MAKVVGFDEKAKERVTCRGCSAIVEYVLKEVEHYTHYDYGGGSDPVYYVNCPNCGEKIFVKRGL